MHLLYVQFEFPCIFFAAATNHDQTLYCPASLCRRERCFAEFEAETGRIGRRHGHAAVGTDTKRRIGRQCERAEVELQRLVCTSESTKSVSKTALQHAHKMWHTTTTKIAAK